MTFSAGGDGGDDDCDAAANDGCCVDDEDCVGTDGCDGSGDASGG